MTVPLGTTPEATGARVPAEPPALPERESHARGWKGLGWGFVVKLLIMAVINTAGVATIISAIRAESWIILGVSVALLILADLVYFSRRALPLKYLLPGLAFLLIFQVFIFGYTAFIAFTNYGSGHIGTQEQAVNAALIQGERRVEDSATYPLSVVERVGEIGFAIVGEDDDVQVGTAEQPLTEAPDAQVGDSGAPSEVPGWTVVPRAQLITDQELQARVQALRVPVSDDPNDGSIRTRDGATGSVYLSTLEWDEQAQTITDTTSGTVYTANDHGSFVAEDGTALPAGWAVTVGFENFVALFTNPTLFQPLLLVTGWTFAWAILSVLVPFAMGLILALIYNDARLKGRRFLRTLYILPYAFPAFLSALLFRGMFNAEFGVINELFFFGANINWLGDPWLARGAVLWVNIWLTYPYFFLVCTGALQALPADTLEAASIDGAGAGRKLRSIVLPLVLVATAPLLIASFAFSFNNFTVIYLFNDGGPAIPGAPYALGATDILITAIYDIAGISGGVANFGLASALSILIFIVVGLISALAFRQTRKLEEFM